MDLKLAPRSSLLTGYPHFLTIATSFSRVTKWPRSRLVPPVLGSPSVPCPLGLPRRRIPPPDIVSIRGNLVTAGTQRWVS